MKLFADPKVKYISLDEYITKTDSFSLKDNCLDNEIYYLTESFAIIAKFRTVCINFGEDIEDRFDHFIIAPRDGKTEYDAINKKISGYEKQLKKNKSASKVKYALSKYKKIINDIPPFVPYKQAGSGNHFESSLIKVEYQANKVLAKKYVVLDVETNGLRKNNDDLLSISIYDPFKQVCYNRFLPLDMQPSVATSWINGINDSDLRDKVHINQEEANEILKYFQLNNCTILVYGPDNFDLPFVQNYFRRHGITGFENLKTENIKRYIPSGSFELAGSASKDNLCRLFGIDGVEDTHSGLNDCLLEWKLFERFISDKPIRVGNSFYKFNPEYVVPASVLIQNPKIYGYANIPLRYILGTKHNLFHFDVPTEALKKIKKFDTNITGISVENIIYASLGAVKQNNVAFLAKNKSNLERIASVKTHVDEIPIMVRDDGLIDAVNEKDKVFVEEVNSVAMILKDGLNPALDYIKNEIFCGEEIMSQELVFSENNKVLALCDLSSESSIMEIKTISPQINKIGYLDSKITYQMFYQAKERNAFYLNINVNNAYEGFDKIKYHPSCSVDIFKIELNEYSFEEYENKVNELTFEEERFLDFVKTHPMCQYGDLEIEFKNYSRRMLQNRMKSLEKKKHIRRVGNKRFYHWEIIE